MARLAGTGGSRSRSASRSSAPRRGSRDRLVTGWIVLGATFTVLPWLDGCLLALALVSVVGGFVAPFGIAALNAVITEHTSGDDRRTAFAAQHVAGSGGSSIGMLTGGAVIAVLGAESTMHVAGVVLVAAPVVLVARTQVPGRRQASRGTKPAVVLTERGRTKAD